MQRARRLASVAVVASLGVAGLSACRSAPSVAAYLGDDRITEARVSEVWDEAQDAATKAAGGAATSLTITRSDVVRTLISVDVLKQVAAKQNVKASTETSVDDYASSLRVPAGTEFVQLYAQADGYVTALRSAVKDAPEASDEDYQAVYDVLAAAGQVEGYTFDQFKQALPDSNKSLVQTASVVRKEIAEVTDQIDITVNPRYQGLGIAVLQFQTSDGDVRPLVTVPLGDTGTSTVTDVS